jgi:hypothetical protein
MTDGGERDERGGVRWWSVLPDVEATTSAAHLLTTESETVVAHSSGRPCCWATALPPVSG